MTRLALLKKKIQEQRKHLDDLDHHMYVFFPLIFCPLTLGTHLADLAFLQHKTEQGAGG